MAFVPIVFVLYWFVFQRSLRAQNSLLIIASYVFYGWWDWRFLSLIALSSVIDYVCGRKMAGHTTQLSRKPWLLLSLTANLGLLGTFKYFNFFSESFAEAFRGIGYEMDSITLDLILPVGISFYTFQTMSYAIDVYRGDLKATKSATSFFAYVSFFPQLVAGPIERAGNFLPQFENSREFNAQQAIDGCRQILWGLFKKIVIADNCAIVVNAVYENPASHSASELWVAAIFFSFQIYGDFSGYSDIAIGTSRLFGFDLKRNFAFPYFSRDIAEFWRRWHISLSTWFRDYIYIPLGGSRGGNLMKIRNTFAIFIVSGLWHGANWTFIVWGALNALYFLPAMVLGKNRQYLDVVATGRFLPNSREFVQMISLFVLTSITWVVFRSESLHFAYSYIYRMFGRSIFEYPEVDLAPFAAISILVLVEWFNRAHQHGLVLDGVASASLRWSSYLAIILAILFFGANPQEFIYFQF